MRVSNFVGTEDKLLEYRFEDAKTLYECFQRGKRVSSECVGCIVLHYRFFYTYLCIYVSQLFPRVYLHYLALDLLSV